jgi:hypothetical protein
MRITDEKPQRGVILVTKTPPQLVPLGVFLAPAGRNIGHDISLKELSTIDML